MLYIYIKKIMNIHKLFNNNDMFMEITSYLDFNDKMILNKTINKNCLTKYNFNSINFRYKNIDDIFTLYNEENDDEFCEYMSDLSSFFSSELNKYYDEFYGYDIEDYMNDYYNNLKYEKHRDLTELFYSSYLRVYTRKVAEYIENHNLSIIYYDYDFFELEKKINIDIHDLVINYYKYVFENEDIDLFCERCGSFGHYNASKECIFYNVYNENKLIKKDVNKTMTNILDKIIENHHQEKMRLKREPFLCYYCKINNKHNKCSNNYCGKCCNGCKIHK